MINDITLAFFRVFTEVPVIDVDEATARPEDSVWALRWELPVVPVARSPLDLQRAAQA